MLNTRFDYEYIKEQNIDGWQEQYRQLLEGRFITQDDELIEDTGAPIFHIGFTVAEVTDAIGFAGYTNTEHEWYQSQPDRYVIDNGVYTQVSDWPEIAAEKRRLQAIADKCQEVDAAVSMRQNQPFVFNGHNYYPDTETIQGIFSALPYLPENYSREWKTADKGGDGTSNVYVTLDKASLAGLAMAYLQFRSTTWEQGDALKRQAKAAPTTSAVEAIEVIII